MTDLFLERDAVLSDCKRYRYLLRRTWDHDLLRVLFITLNPSTADAEVDDATIQSCVRLAKGWGAGSIEVVNLFGWRATKPEELSRADDPVGPRNDGIAEAAVNRCDLCICAWGAHPMAVGRDKTMWHLVKRHRPAAFCLGVTKPGAPKHPLYIKTGTPLRNYHPGMTPPPDTPNPERSRT